MHARMKGRIKCPSRMPFNTCSILLCAVPPNCDVHAHPAVILLHAFRITNALHQLLQESRTKCSTASVKFRFTKSFLGAQIAFFPFVTKSFRLLSGADPSLEVKATL